MIRNNNIRSCPFYRLYNFKDCLSFLPVSFAGTGLNHGVFPAYVICGQSMLKSILCLPNDIKIQDQNGHFTLTAKTFGEVIDPSKHELNVDVKAVTFHRFKVSQTDEGWEAIVILDI